MNTIEGQMAILKDPILSALSNIMCCSLPFIAIGLFDDTLVLLLAAIIGGASLVFFCVQLLRLLLKKVGNSDFAPIFLRMVNEILLFPYIILLTSTILIYKGIDAMIGIWVAGFMTICIIISYLLTIKSIDKGI